MRTQDQLVRDQLAALAAFHRSRSEPIVVGAGYGAARETRHEHERREAVRAREQEALRARASAIAELQEWGARPRAVVVHRAPWTREALRRGLGAAGVEVVALHEDGAAGLGCVVAEQPDVVLVQQQLPWRDGLEVVAEVRRFAPATLVAMHLDQPGTEASAWAAGAHACFPRATRPADLVAGLVALQQSALQQSALQQSAVRQPAVPV